MDISALILAKRHSNRLPNKNLLEVDGKPMFLVNVEKCLEIFEDVYVSSDSNEILQMAREAGAKTIKRGDELCGEVPNITVYQHALKHMGDVEGVVAVQANSPQVDSKAILLAKGLLEFGVQEIMASHPVKHNKDYHKQSAKIYGSIWALSRERLEQYEDPYKPEPGVLITDTSVDIETKDEYNKVIQCQSIPQS